MKIAAYVMNEKVKALSSIIIVLLRLSAPFVFAHGFNLRAFVYTILIVTSLHAAYSASWHAQRREWTDWGMSFCGSLGCLFVTWYFSFPITFLIYLTAMLPLSFIPERVIHVSITEKISNVVCVTAILYELLL
jgi:hypothetical protein